MDYNLLMLQKYTGGAEELSFSGKHWVIMESNYDGDTVTLVIWHFNRYIKMSCRLYGINTGEIRGAKTDEEKNYALKAKKFVEQYNGQVLTCVFHPECKDPYKRPIVELFPTEDKSINMMLLDAGLAAEYYGYGEKNYK